MLQCRPVHVQIAAMLVFCSNQASATTVARPKAESKQQ
jgi:hypothetical protein